MSKRLSHEGAARVVKSTLESRVAVRVTVESTFLDMVTSKIKTARATRLLAPHKANTGSPYIARLAVKPTTTSNGGWETVILTPDARLVRDRDGTEVGQIIRFVNK